MSLLVWSTQAYVNTMPQSSQVRGPSKVTSKSDVQRTCKKSKCYISTLQASVSMLNHGKKKKKITIEELEKKD